MRCCADTSTLIHVEREDMIMITFGEKLRYLRPKNNLTQKQLGIGHINRHHIITVFLNLFIVHNRNRISPYKKR